MLMSMVASQVDLITAQDADVESALLALNNAHARETSFLTMPEWRALVGLAYAATCIDQAAALMIAVGDAAAYDGVNFQWFKSKLDRYIYVDRIIVAESHRGAGLARTLYDDLFERMRASGHHTVACEVNAVPPNPGSKAFHAGLGFLEIGRATLHDRGKTVKYLIKEFGKNPRSPSLMS